MSAHTAPLKTEPPLRLFPPYIAFRLDIEDRLRMRDLELRRIELTKSIAEFAEPKHMAMFGRPLGPAYSDPVQMNEVAKLKLVGGRKGAIYNPNNLHHVF